ncbi:hypothetical protein SAMN05216360_12555 [Methylobacterium phyllostachyos]|uniref:Uncharacterized protein n=1 Tax=Methylobacterium phyllostachyos TaxID=582672 RepID=A0A1H0K9N4_9HYPH|nr:hypothetical protein [Methylobacterium phyllostachyos]SDO52599.1 hypothetical protein SAMN05216360_12555 [Methylobacterium phyllostachyos]
MPSFEDTIIAVVGGAARGLVQAVAGKTLDWLRERRAGRKPNLLPPPQRNAPRVRRTRARPQVRSALILRSRDRTPPRN